MIKSLKLISSFEIILYHAGRYILKGEKRSILLIISSYSKSKPICFADRGKRVQNFRHNNETTKSKTWQKRILWIGFVNGRQCVSLDINRKKENTTCWSPENPEWRFHDLTFLSHGHNWKANQLTDIRFFSREHNKKHKKHQTNKNNGWIRSLCLQWKDNWARHIVFNCSKWCSRLHFDVSVIKYDAHDVHYNALKLSYATYNNYRFFVQIWCLIYEKW